MKVRLATAREGNVRPSVRLPGRLWLAKEVSAMGKTSVFAYICVKGAAEAIDYYSRAFGAVERRRMTVPTGELGHAELQIGKGILFLADEYPAQQWLSPTSLSGRSVGLVLAVDKCEAVMQQAIDA